MSEQGAAAPETTRRRSGASVRRLAEELSLSVATVSRALNNHPEVSDATRKRVAEAALASGYTASVGKRPTNVLGLLFPEKGYEEFSGFKAAVMSGIMRVASESHFDLAFVNAAEEKHPAESYTHFLARRGIAGALLRGPRAPEQAVELAREGFPAIVLVNRSEEASVSYVDADSRGTSRRAVEYLTGLGHERIAHATFNVDSADFLDRRAGYEDGLRAAGLPVDPELVVSASPDRHGGALMLDRLLRLDEPPTAIYFTTPHTTMGAMIRCLELGIRVPEDLSIIGVDDSDVRYQTFPSFTAITQDVAGMAAEATRWLVARINGQASGVYRVVKETTLSIERSTGYAPHQPVRLDGGGRVIR
ncbi:MAG: hypothetical protein CMJ31_02475 [Phycisphaerae bacterium]|nr:hypothetical protein [Phycisphaerae bacterium]